MLSTKKVPHDIEGQKKGHERTWDDNCWLCFPKPVVRRHGLALSDDRLRLVVLRLWENIGWSQGRKERT